MPDSVYRPWGRAQWLLPAVPKVKKWAVIGCLGTESRSVKSLVELSKYASNFIVAKIVDPDPESAKANSKILDENFKRLSSHISSVPIEHDFYDMKASLDTIFEIIDRAALNSPNVILDITSFPKRWFFPLVKSLVNHELVENLMVTYTRGDRYALSLSENPEILRAIPSFISYDERTEHDCSFVGVGFHTHKLLELFGEDRPKTMDMLFPFPPGPVGMKDNWRFVEQVERVVQQELELDAQPDPINMMQIDSLDVSQAFNFMMIKTDSGNKTSVMAPYGPKTFSLAMCLFAIAADNGGKPDVPVFYSQPQRYNPEYTSNAKFDDNGEIEIWAYAIKIESKNLYSM